MTAGHVLTYLVATVPLLAGGIVATPVAGQGTANGQAGPRPLLAEEAEIALARSAAPAAVSMRATVYVLTETGYEVAVEGSNGAACYVSRAWVASLEPHCFDPEGARTILPLKLRTGEMRHRGQPQEAIDQVIREGLADGTFTLPTRPAVSYMMSEGQRLIAPDGTAVGNWKPHLMIYYPSLSAADIGYTDPRDHADISLVDAGQPLSNLMVVVPEFIPVRTDPGGG